MAQKFEMLLEVQCKLNKKVVFLFSLSCHLWVKVPFFVFVPVFIML